MSVQPGLSPAEIREPAITQPVARAPILAAQRLVKRFSGVTVLDGVSLALRPGEVRALLGENGAGKSTLINLLSGVYQPDGGELLFNARPVHFTRPLAASAAGISVIRQELALFPDLSVAEAIFAGHLPHNRLGLVDWRRVRHSARAALAQLGLTSLDINQRVASLSIAQQQLVEIARALTRQARVVIMDEPTASLSPEEVRHLGNIIARLAGENVAILYVSHRIDEIRAFCHSCTVLRDGKVVADGRIADMTPSGLIMAMAGREVNTGRKAGAAQPGRDILAVHHLAAPASGRVPARVSDVSFTVRAGEILGVAGIVGAGRTETARMLFGLDPIGAGRIVFNGKPFRPASVRGAIAAGIGYVPEDRKGLSLLPNRSVLENFAITSAVAPKHRFLNDQQGERAAFSFFAQRLGIRFPGLQALITTLSGGNQQKVILARWIARSPQLLIVDEPTRGVDIGAKEEVHDLLREVASKGVAVLVISSDLPEIMALADRVVTLCEGRTTFEATLPQVSAATLMAKMTRHTA